jgi:predicted RNase H-like nuclease
VALFALKRTLKYKRKPGRSAEQIHSQFQRYQALLAGLVSATPPLLDAESLLTIEVAQLRGRALQAVEEALDALTCAYVAWYAWWHGPAHQLVYGDVATGHILVPHPATVGHATSVTDSRPAQRIQSTQPASG